MDNTDKIIQKKRNSARSTFLFVATVLIFLSVAAILALVWYTDATENPNTQSEDTVEFIVNEGESLTTIAPRLEDSEVIKSELALKIYLNLKNLNILIKPGKYTIPKNLTLTEILDLLQTGQPKEFAVVRVKEAQRYEQVSADIYATIYNNAKDKTIVKFSESEFNTIASNPDAYTFSTKIEDFLNKYKPAGKPLRGFLYPDTYNINTDATTQQVIELLINNFINKIEDKFDLDNLNSEYSFYEMLTLASVIEREARTVDEKYIIAGIFYNRLKDGIPLQSDATVNFVTGKNDPGATLEDIKIDNPYNTYKYAGLMPSPINTPVISSIDAAINPQKTDYYYFRHDCGADIHYSKTYSEHLQCK